MTDGTTAWINEDEGGPEHPKADRTKPQPDPVPANKHYLAHDCATSEWSLWRRSEDRKYDHQMISWRGEVLHPDNEEGSYTHWDLVRYMLYYVEPDDASLIIMGARHLDTPGWQGFAARHVERAKLKPVG